MAKNEPILVVNHFNGVTVANHSTVLGYNRVSVKISVNKYQGVVLQVEHQSLMVTDVCSDAIQAKVDFVNLAAREAYLTEFRFVEKLINVREQVRICPQQQIEVGFPSYPEVKGLIHDISFDGLGFYIPREDANYEKFEKGKQIIVHINLPMAGGDQRAEIPCEIKKVFLESENLRLRIGVKTMADAENRAIISTFISQNMLEICTELDSLYKDQINKPVFVSNS